MEVEVVAVVVIVVEVIDREGEEEGGVRCWRSRDKERVDGVDWREE